MNMSICLKASISTLSSPTSICRTLRKLIPNGIGFFLIQDQDTSNYNNIHKATRQRMRRYNFCAQIFCPQLLFDLEFIKDKRFRVENLVKIWQWAGPSLRVCRRCSCTPRNWKKILYFETLLFFAPAAPKRCSFHKYTKFYNSSTILNIEFLALSFLIGLRFNVYGKTWICLWQI